MNCKRKEIPRNLNFLIKIYIEKVFIKNMTKWKAKFRDFLLQKLYILLLSSTLRTPIKLRMNDLFYKEIWNGMRRSTFYLEKIECRIFLLKCKDVLYDLIHFSFTYVFGVERSINYDGVCCKLLKNNSSWGFRVVFSKADKNDDFTVNRPRIRDQRARFI